MSTVAANKKERDEVTGIAACSGGGIPGQWQPVHLVPVVSLNVPLLYLPGQVAASSSSGKLSG